MNIIEFQMGSKKRQVKTPSSWDELSAEQFIEVVNYLSQKGGHLSLNTFDIPYLKQLSPIQVHHLRNTFAFLEEKPDISKLLIKSFSVGGVEYVGYQSGFSNTTWEEFLYADQYFMDNRYLAAIAVLYREQKKRRNYDGQSDIRIPFSIYGTETRLAKIKTLSPSMIAAIALNYRALRERNIVQKYPAIFSPLGTAEETQSGFSWVRVHRNILSEHFFEEEKFFKSNVHAVLHRMNNLIEENKKRKK